MIEPVPPTRQLVIDVLEGLLSRKYAREEVVEWWHAVHKRFGLHGQGPMPLHLDEGYWDFMSMAYLLEPAPSRNPGNEGPYFVRDCDIAEWLGCLMRSGAPHEDGGIVRRHRWRQEKPADRSPEPHLPLVCLNDPANTFFSSMGIKPTRGIVDDLFLATEYAAIEWQGQALWIEKHDLPSGKMDHVCIHGVSAGSAGRVASLLVEIGIAPGQLDWVSEAARDGDWILRRIDTNANEFVMREYASYIEARLWQAHYERKGHRQTYLIDRKPESPAP